MKYNNNLQTIGNTPCARINYLFRNDTEAWMKKTICITLLFCFYIVVPGANAAVSESEKAYQLFEQLFDAEVKRSPVMQTYLGIKDNYGEWDDISLKREKENYNFSKLQLKTLRKINKNLLDKDALLSYQLYEKKLANAIEGYKWRHYNYPANQMFGVHSGIPSLLINMHKVSNQQDADAYIARLEAVPTYINQLIEGLEARKKAKIVAPKFVYPYVIDDSKNIISGYPFQDGDDSVLLADFKEKVATLNLDDDAKKVMEKRAETALIEKVRPAYEKLIAYLITLEKVADTRDGVWKFPKGEQFYQYALKTTTTTDLTADQIHQLGLDEVKRIHSEMLDIMKQVEFKGSLNEFFTFMRTDKQFYYPDTEEGRQAYLDKATNIINTMKGQLDTLFTVKPKADLIVKAVEPFREKSAGRAFYSGPSLDGSRPGTYYANLYDMTSMPIYQLEALAYHEGVPGHHMQISIALEIETMPTFRKYGRYIAYIEGWGLYSELIPKESGFYKDPYSDFGRLSMELWRAVRLVVDTGLHARKWTREQAIQYTMDNSPSTPEDAVKSIERYIVMPSQATAYKIGMIKILELRERAQQTLKDEYDVREFHDVVLKNGALPLDVLENLVDEWLAKKRAAIKTET